MKAVRNTISKTLQAESVKKSRYLEFWVTGGLYRIDVGFLLLRPPIIEDLTETEMKRRILVHKFRKENDLYPKVEDSMFDFSFRDPLDDFKSKDPNYRITHEKKDEKGNYIRFHQFSRDINHIDLTETDPKSIQIYPKHTVYLLVKDKTGRWGIPYQTLEQESYFILDSDRLKVKVLGFDVSTTSIDNYPTFCFTEPISEEELSENKLLSKTKGKKIYGMKKILNTGHVGKQVLNHFEDFHWVPKVKMREYLDRDRYNSIIHSLTH